MPASQAVPVRIPSILFAGSFLSSARGTRGIAESVGQELAGRVRLSYASSYQSKSLRLAHVLSSAAFQHYDAVHCDVFSGQSFWVADLVRRIAALRKKRVIANIQGGQFLELIEESSRHLRALRAWARDGVRLASPSAFLITGLADRWGIHAQRLPNFIDQARFPYDERPRTGHRLLWVRAFSAAYQPQLAVQTVACLRDSFADVSLTMVGPDKGTLSATRQLIDELGVSDRIEITGPVANVQLATYFRTHDVYLNTTAYESFGLAVLEAASCGAPVISTRVGELPYIWSHEKDILFARAQTGEAFADAVSRLFTDTAMGAAIQQNAKRTADGFRWSEVRDTWCAVLGV